jgi:WD40 repeat protein
VSASWDYSIKFWDVDSGNCESTLLGHTSPVRCLAPTANRAHLLSGSDDGKIILWNLWTCQQLASFDCHDFGDPVLCLVATPNGRSFISSGCDTTLKLFHFEDPRQPALIFVGHTGQVISAIISQDNNRLYSGGTDNCICIWSIATAHQLAVLPSHAGPVSCLALTENFLVSGSWDGCLKLWHAGDGQLVHSVQAHTSAVNSIAVTADGANLISGGRDQVVGLWQVSFGRLDLMERLLKFSDFINSVTVSSDGFLLAVDCSSNQTICIYDLTLKQAVAPLHRNSHNETLSVVLFL